MEYKDALAWLYQQLPMYQRQGKKAIKKDLTNIVALCKYLNHPQNQYKTIHVAGTNGKGSTSHMLSSILQEAGYKVGLLTSPHLKDFRERIKINGSLCSQEFVVEFVEQHQDQIKHQKASFFEVTTAMAFAYFKQESVDIAIIETGLGGELDSTNIVQPILSVITNVGWDHMDVLGNTLAQIAQAKAGIIKPKTPVVVGEKAKESEPIFRKMAQKNQSPLYFVDDFTFPTYLSDLIGLYQKKNIELAVVVSKILQKDLSISDSDLEVGLLKVKQNTNLQGRWDVLQENPKIIADVGHNHSAMQFIVKQLQAEAYGKLHLVLGFVQGKNVSKILYALPKDANCYFTQPNLLRKYPIQKLKQMVPDYLKANFYDSVDQALVAAKRHATKEDLIFVGGSTFVVAEAI